MSWLVHLEVEVSELDITSSRLWNLGTTGIAELEGNNVVAGFETEAEAQRAVADLGQGHVTKFDPLTVPDGEPSEVDFGSRVINLVNTNAFGHGSHPTTSLALQAIDRLVDPEMRVLDMGCGTGVLGIGACFAGAEVTAIDNDPAAIEITRTNALANDVSLDLCTTLSEHHGAFDFIVANMLLADLRPVASQLVDALTDGGTIATTGFLENQIDQVVELFQPLTVRDKRSAGEWVLLELA